jgi:predicted HD phosphohydrolase
MASRSPLARPDWRYVEKPALEDFRAEDWALLERQRRLYYADEQARQVLRMLAVTAEDPTFGYQVSIPYGHGLQAATMAMRDGQDEETVVVALLHDIGFVTCPATHEEFAAALLGPYVSEKNEWMLRHHAIFQQVHVHEHPDVDRHERERWRGHPYFEWTATFVEQYDQRAIRADYDTAPLEVFAPMVFRLFARPPRGPRRGE